MLYYEHKFKRKGFDTIIGVDEAGRGPLAGPVVAAAVFLHTHSFKSRIDDSKKLSATARERAFFEIIAHSVHGIGIVNESVIDRINILEATRVCMEQAVHNLMHKLRARPSAKPYVIVDGTMALSFEIPYTSIVKGDTKSLSIASASILAKVTRDRIMQLYDKVYPEYVFGQHKGYSTQQHRSIVRKIGPSRIHRKSFCCV